MLSQNSGRPSYAGRRSGGSGGAKSCSAGQCRTASSKTFMVACETKASTRPFLSHLPMPVRFCLLSRGGIGRPGYNRPENYVEAFPNYRCQCRLSPLPQGDHLSRLVRCGRGLVSSQWSNWLQSIGGTWGINVTTADPSPAPFTFYPEEFFNGAVAHWAAGAWIERMLDVTQYAGVRFGNWQSAAAAEDS